MSDEQRWHRHSTPAALTEHMGDFISVEFPDGSFSVGRLRGMNRYANGAVQVWLEGVDWPLSVWGEDGGEVYAK